MSARASTGSPARENAILSVTRRIPKTFTNHGDETLPLLAGALRNKLFGPIGKTLYAGR